MRLILKILNRTLEFESIWLMDLSGLRQQIYYSNSKIEPKINKFYSPNISNDKNQKTIREGLKKCGY